jgi:hypothetical protein
MAFTQFDEDVGSPVFSFRPFQSTARRTGKIPGSQLTNLLNELFPLGLQPKVLSSEYNWLFAQGLHAEPYFGGDGKAETPAPDEFGSVSQDIDVLNTYADLKVTIEYGTNQPGNNPENQGDDPVELLEHRWSTGGEFVTLPSGGFQWHPDDGDVDDDVRPGLLLPHFEQSITWPRVENPPFSIIRDRIGCVNNSTVNFVTGSCPPETLLFLGAELHRTVLTTGALAWDVTYRFSERRCPLAESDTLGGVSGAASISVGGWNHFFRCELDGATQEVQGVELTLAGKTGFYRIKVRDDGRTGAGNPIYALKSFDALFQEAA